VAVEGVDRGLRGRDIVADVAQGLADVSPVLLLDVGVVVLLGPPTRELDLLSLAVVVQVLVDDLRAVRSMPGTCGNVPNVIGRDDRAMAVGWSMKIVRQLARLTTQRPAKDQVERAVFRSRK
jgi:hypothetical protein